MSTLKVDAIRATSGSSDAISLNATTGVTAINSGAIGGPRNLIVNGAMQVNQYGSTSQVDNSFICDRFRVDWDNVNNAPEYSKVDLSSSDTGPWAKGFRHALELKNGDQTSNDAGDYFLIQYKTEAQDIASCGWDYTSSSSYITLSFWVKSSVAQNFYGHLTSDDGTAQNYPFETGSLSANTWTKVTKKIPGNSNLAFNNDTGQGLTIRWAANYGSTYTGTPTLNTWAAYSSSARTPVFATTWWTEDDATLQITGVQLEVGPAASEFEHLRYSDDLRRCQRYYFATTGSVGGAGDAYSANSVSGFRWYIPWPTTMRADPATTVSGGADGGSAASLETVTAHADGCVMNLRSTDTSRNVFWYAATLTASAEI